VLAIAEGAVKVLAFAEGIVKVLAFAEGAVKKVLASLEMCLALAILVSQHIFQW